MQSPPASAGPGLTSGQQPSRDYGVRYRSRPDVTEVEVGVCQAHGGSSQHASARVAGSSSARVVHEAVVVEGDV